MKKRKRKKRNCRPTFRISEAGHLLRTEGTSRSGRILSTEGKAEKQKRQRKGCLNGPEGTFRLTESQKRKLPKKLQRAILEHHRKQGKIILD